MAESPEFLAQSTEELAAARAERRSKFQGILADTEERKFNKVILLDLQKQMQVSQNVVRTLHSDPTFKPDKDSVVVQLMGQIRNTEDTISSVLVALEYGPDMATIYRLNQIKGTYETTVKPQANLKGVDNPEESQATLEGIDDPEGSTVNLEGLDDPKESLANLEGENSDLKSEIIALKKKFAEMETDMKKEVGALDGRLSQAEKRTAVCGYKIAISFDSDTTLTFDRVYDEVNSGGVLAESGYFTATIEGVYLVTLKTSVALNSPNNLSGYLKLSSGQYGDNNEDEFIYSANNAGGYIVDQASASRYVKMAAGETLHITLEPGAEPGYGGISGEVRLWRSMLCVSLYSASG